MDSIEKYLKESSDYRLDESDKEYFRYERYPSSRLDTGFHLETSCGEYQVFTMPYEPSQKWQEKEEENIDIIEPKNPDESNFRRDVLLWIVHHPPSGENHLLQFVIDQRSQNHGNGDIIGPHINPRPEDEKKFRSCDGCDNFFSWLDHEELQFKQKENYKVMDLDSTVSKVREKIVRNMDEDYNLKVI